jgi:hypothetical protein
MAAHDSLCSHLTPNGHLLTKERLSTLTLNWMKIVMKHFDKGIVHI